MKEGEKRVLIISPQGWGKALLSKHNYALELAQMGYRVFFLCPPQINQVEKFEASEIRENLFVVNHRFNFPYILKFRARWIFDQLVKKHVKQLMAFLGVQLDVVWCFDPNIYSNLGWFKAVVKIYHPVDPIDYPEQIKIAHTADFIFSVSEKILSSFDGINKPKHFINHGLGKPFETLGKSLLDIEVVENKGTKRFGYVGNLLRPIIGREVFKRLIQELPQVEFHFWGFYELKGSNLSGENDSDTKEFIQFLKESTNVWLHGSRSPEELAQEIIQMDAFLLYYKPMKGMSDLSNSHKILEYLSTGKTVLSCPISTYQHLPHLLEMQGEGEDYVDFVKDKVKHLSNLNTSYRKRRIKFALENTYKNQIEKIFNITEKEFFQGSI